MKMKNYKIFSLLVCLMSAFILSSCLSEDNTQTGLTDAEIRQCLNTVRGDYNGEMIYSAQNPDVSTDKTDTLDMSWRINNADTSIVIYDFPAELIANAMPDVVDKEIKEALMDASEADLKGSIYFSQSVPLVGFQVSPKPLEYFVNYGGKNHKISAYFYQGPYSFGLHSASDKRMQMQFVLGGIYIDNNLNYNLIDGKMIPFVFNSKW